MIGYWKFTFEGTDSVGESWRTECEVAAERGDLEGAFINARHKSFRELTQGAAVYGKPGVGCKGPYRIQKVTMEAQS